MAINASPKPNAERVKADRKMIERTSRTSDADSMEDSVTFSTGIVSEVVLESLSHVDTDGVVFVIARSGVSNHWTNMELADFKTIGDFYVRGVPRLVSMMMFDDEDTGRYSDGQVLVRVHGNRTHEIVVHVIAEDHFKAGS